MKPETPRNVHSLIEQKKDLNAVYQDVQQEMHRVEESLKVFSDSPSRLVSEISTYLFRKKGKRIRPALLLLCSKLLGYKGEEHIFLAALVESIHTASLIHDDIIDKADFRRGEESVHTRWGPNISVLLGDFLYIKAIALSLQSRYPQIIHILTDISTKMIEGELTEYDMSGNAELGEDDYLDIISKKTAALFSASCQIGGILGRASSQEENSLLSYGNNLGMTFQIIDDLLDFKGDAQSLGKPVLSDLGEGRITLPLIYTFNNDGNANRRRLLQILRNKKLAPSSKREILEIVRSNGALDYTYQRAAEFSLRCRKDIALFPESPHREALSLLSEFVPTRDK
jgi:octaprenyl-diphosphate synthase